MTALLWILDVEVLIYLIHHVAQSIQLPRVIASIAGDLTRAIEVESSDRGRSGAIVEAGPPVAERRLRMEEGGTPALGRYDASRAVAG